MNAVDFDICPKFNDVRKFISYLVNLPIKTQVLRTLGNILNKTLSNTLILPLNLQESDVTNLWACKMVA